MRIFNAKKIKEITEECCYQSDWINSKWVSLEDLQKKLISLAYQKVNGKIERIDINHLDILKSNQRGKK